MPLFDTAEYANLQALMRQTFRETYTWTRESGNGADASRATLGTGLGGRKKTASPLVLLVGNAAPSPAQHWTLYVDTGDLPRPQDRFQDEASQRRYRVLSATPVAGGPMASCQVEEVGA